jgi:single-strand DNA-binding protein
MDQKVVIVGNVGRDAEMRYTPSGVPVTSFSIAVNRRWSNANGEQQEKTTWFRVTCWRKLAETAAQYVKKGKLLLVEGEVEAQAYVDREGNARGTLEMTANTFKFLGGPRDGAEGGGPPTGGGDDFPVHEDDIPF